MVLFAAVLAVRALDLLFDSWAAVGRKHALITGGVFALAAMFALYATLPYLWANPIERSVEMFATLAHHPTMFPPTVPGRVDNGKRSAGPLHPNLGRHYDPRRSRSCWVLPE